MKPLNFTRTKIVCTIGPASDSREMLRQLILSGMDVARVNQSHGTHDYHRDVIRKVRELNQELGTHVAILLDLQGPKIRIGPLDSPIPVKPGDVLTFCTAIKEKQGDLIPVQYQSFGTDVKPGDMVLVDDGKVELTVLETNKIDTVKLRVNHGDEISSKKGINLPITNISLPSITDKDKADVAFGVEMDVDWIALSFVRKADEIYELRELITTMGGDARIIAKVEKPEALKNIDEIIEAADAIMVARGDMGVEIPLEEVPLWQKTIVSKSNAAAKPVIVATQMMESMITNRRPTRAETSDVANAVMDGADALMLSGETAAGKFPIEVVKSMQRIIQTMEEQDKIYFRNMGASKHSATWLNDMINVTATELAQRTDAKALIGFTLSGYTAFWLSKCRPKGFIHIFTENKKLLTVLSLVWGVRAYYYDRNISTDNTFSDIGQFLKAQKYVRKDDVVIFTASMPIQARQRTNTIKLELIS